MRLRSSYATRSSIDAGLFLLESAAQAADHERSQTQWDTALPALDVLLGEAERAGSVLARGAALGQAA